MKEEFSAGGVVYRKTEDGVEFLIGKHSGYHKWVLPKGLIESGETPEEAAVREVKEETGIVAKIIKPTPLHTEEYEYEAEYRSEDSDKKILRRVVQYQESGGKGELVKKEVVFYLMKYVSGDVEDHSWEMEEVLWVLFDDALEKLSFEGDKLALKKAWEGIQ
ncbi:NUDIX hydrolase [Patescibacteria group bacterium]